MGGRDAGGFTVGAGVPLAGGVAVGGAVGTAVGVGVGAAVGVGDGVGDGDGDGDGDGEALALALGLARRARTWPTRTRSGSATPSTAYGLTSESRMLPLTSVRVMRSFAFCLIRPTPCRSARKNCSWAMMSSAQAIWVFASAPTATTVPFVV